jgi:sugar lactone lactonase YvrE
VLRKSGGPRIDSFWPSAVVPGGELTIFGHGFQTSSNHSPEVRFGERLAAVSLWAETVVVARVPEGAENPLRIVTGRGESEPVSLAVARAIASDFHQVANPAVDSEGNIYATFSGQRGQRVAVSLFRISPDFVVRPLPVSLTNPTGLALDRFGVLYVSCRNDGTIYRVEPDGRAEKWIEGMGIATGLAFDQNGFLYVGDRSGTIFKISPEREIFVFATLEPSVAAYHLAFSPAGELFVTGPTTSSYDRVYRISATGEVSEFYAGLGRPQGLAFDREGNLYVAASLAGRRGLVRLTPRGQAELVVAGPQLVGVALLYRRAILATNSTLYLLDWNIEGLPLGG